jgi:thiosulfate/3-mercaptopyruvate sulfurtransferase
VAYPELLTGIDELREHLHDPHWRVVDCRFVLTEPDKGFAAYLQAHIPGAVYAHLDRDLAAPGTAETGRHPLPDASTFAGTLGKWGISRRMQVVVYDENNGAIASRLWWMLRWMGHRAVCLLDGGFDAWVRAELPLEAEPPQIKPAVFEGNPDESMVATTDELLHSLRSGLPLTLVDARDAARFSGTEEPIDPVAGHIPSAINFPFSTSIHEDGRWRSCDELKKAWSGILDNAGASDGAGTWVAMCGSGVTACHLAVSAELAGLPAPRLYVGSWSEWIRDPDRPIAAGDGSGPEPDAEGS